MGFSVCPGGHRACLEGDDAGPLRILTPLTVRGRSHAGVAGGYIYPYLPIDTGENFMTLMLHVLVHCVL